MTESAPWPHADRIHFDAAVGWLMLGVPTDALRELEQLSTAGRLRPEALELEWALRAKSECWIEAKVVAETLVRVAPERPFGWIHLAYCLRRVEGGGLQSAWDLLRPAYDRFPEEEIIPYNLACYAAQMGQLDEAWEWLLTAINVAGDRAELCALALADSDLEPLKDRIREL